ncbi:MAG: HAS-barrel domain-containing protein [Nitrososphaeria archaeon]
MKDVKIYGQYGLVDNSIGEVMSSTFKSFEFELHRQSSSQSIERGSLVVVNNGTSYIFGVVTDTRLITVGSGTTRPSRLRSTIEEIDRNLPELRDRIYNTYDTAITGEYFEGEYTQADHPHHALVHAQVYPIHMKDLETIASAPCDYLHLIYEKGGIDSVLSHLKYLKKSVGDIQYRQFLRDAITTLHVRGYDSLTLVMVNLVE